MAHRVSYKTYLCIYTVTDGPLHQSLPYSPRHRTWLAHLLPPVGVVVAGGVHARRAPEGVERDQRVALQPTLSLDPTPPAQPGAPPAAPPRRRRTLPPTLRRRPAALSRARAWSPCLHVDSVRDREAIAELLSESRPTHRGIDGPRAVCGEAASERRGRRAAVPPLCIYLE